MTKAMTGLVIADAVRRSEIRMDAPVATYLPKLKGSPAGTLTMQELVTHTSGYAEFGGTASFSSQCSLESSPGGHELLHEQRHADDHGSPRARAQRTVISATPTLGSAIAGQAVAAKAALSYADLMCTRLFEPLGMRDTAIEDDQM